MDNINVLIDGRDVRCEGEKNLLEIIRKSGIELPTFCYHSELSVYGACRLCMVEVEGRGASAGMFHHTGTGHERLRLIQKR